MGGVGWANLPRSEILIQEIFGGLAFIRGEGVDFPNLWGKGVVKVDLVVVGSRRGNVVSCLFREYRGEGGILRGEGGFGFGFLGGRREFSSGG